MNRDHDRVRLSGRERAAFAAIERDLGSGAGSPDPDRPARLAESGWVAALLLGLGMALTVIFMTTSLAMATLGMAIVAVGLVVGFLAIRETIRRRRCT